MLINDNKYLSIIETIKSEIKSARFRATISVNSELTMLYYNIGSIINENKSWGNKFIENLAKDAISCRQSDVSKEFFFIANFITSNEMKNDLDNAASKGRFVNNILRKYNRITNY